MIYIVFNFYRMMSKLPCYDISCRNILIGWWVHYLSFDYLNELPHGKTNNLHMVTVQLICAEVSTSAKGWFSHDVAQFV